MLATAPKYVTKYSTAATIYGSEVAPQLDSVVAIDGQPVYKCGRLIACEVQDPIGEGWPGADFRLNWSNGFPQVAVNIHVTGRTYQRRHGDLWVKVQIEWVGDCEPSTFAAGWLRIH